MKTRFVVNLSFLIFLNLLVKPFWILGIDRVVQNKVGPEVYGTYFAVFNYSFLFSIILDFGINNFNSRNISRNHKRLGEYMPNILLLKFFLSALYFLITLLSAIPTGFSATEIKMLGVLALNQVILSVILYLRTNIAAIGRFKTDAVVSVLDRLLTIFICLLFLYAAPFKDRFTIEWFLYAQTGSLLLTAFTAYFLLLPNARLTWLVWPWRFTKKLFLQSLPYALIALTMGIYYRIDGVMIERMLGPDGPREAGAYAASYRLLDALNMFGYLFSVILLPLFSGMIRKGEDIKPIFRLSYGLILLISVTASAVCFTFSSNIIPALYHSAEVHWSQIFSWLILSFIPVSLVYIFGALLLANGNLLLLNIITASGALINIGLNIFLIPRYGALGAAYAMLITQLIVATAFGLGIMSSFQIRPGIAGILKSAAFVIISFGAAMGLQALGLSTLYAITGSLLLSTIMALLFGVIAFADLQKVKSLKSNFF